MEDSRLIHHYRLRLHGIIERIKETYKYFPTAYGKEIIAAGLIVRNLVLIPTLANYFPLFSAIKIL